jgi:hypothetical protein
VGLGLSPAFTPSLQEQAVVAEHLGQESVSLLIGLASGPKPFCNERVQDLHGGGRDQRRLENARIIAKQRELDFLARLQTLLGR